MRKISTPQILIIVLLLVMIALQHYSPKTTDWTEHFNNKKKSPFGMLIFNDIIKQVCNNNIEYNFEKIYNNKKLNNNNTNFLLITNNFSSDSIEIHQLINYIKNGNNVFIAAETIDFELLKYLNLKLKYSNLKQELSLENNKSNNLTNNIFKKQDGYKFTRPLNQKYFELGSENNYQILGTNMNDHPNFISMKIGEGNIFLNLQPRTFTNYHLLYSTSEYALNSISYLPTSHTIIDAYYKPFKIINTSPTKFILSAQPLKIAFYLILFMILLNIVFGVQRRQRIIPVVDPPENKSLEFIQTVGGLYYSSKNHKNISLKLSLQFKEYLYEKYFISDFSFSSQNIQNISEKTGVGKLVMSNILDTINKLNEKENIDENELREFNNHIEIFYKKCI